ncbi:DUF3152 domain-containing protein [Nocardioides limicola]|uniref:DUF3152 domain-containing protein n=1 Tax=Nocardioides limicola TaxID=2803368 RepID=UPI00193B1F4C|nr:DUF3152 domain-containing protein [Nocardioides sp. DJM-14]
MNFGTRLVTVVATFAVVAGLSQPVAAGSRYLDELPDLDGVAGSARTETEDRPVLENRVLPRVEGTVRFRHTVRAYRGRWAGGRGASYRFQWLRNGRPIRGATQKRYTISHLDVGQRIRVRVTARRTGWVNNRASSKPRRALHRIGVNRVVRYEVRTRGHVTADLGTFRRQAHQTLLDARGWRNAGVEFRRVASGGQFTLWLSQASQVPTFSSACSSYYSCRVGRNVIINEDRWKWATPSWRSAGGQIRGYRHMVVNHEVGHFLGHGHRGCPGAGRLAPVMMQQSKALNGCRHNPWPLPSELWHR